MQMLDEFEYIKSDSLIVAPDSFHLIVLTPEHGQLEGMVVKAVHVH